MRNTRNFGLAALTIIAVALCTYLLVQQASPPSVGTDEVDSNQSRLEKSHLDASRSSNAKDEAFLRADHTSEKLTIATSNPNLTSPSSGKVDHRSRSLFDLIARPDIDQVIAQLNQSADPADWRIASSLNLWCATVGSVTTDSAVSVFKALGSSGEHTKKYAESLQKSCGDAASNAFSAPNLRGTEFSTTEYAWKAARSIHTLAAADPSEASHALVALGANGSLLASWLATNNYSLLDAPVLAELPPIARSSAIALAMCESSSGICSEGSLVSVASCLTSMGRWCGAGGDLDSKIVNSTPEGIRAAMQAKSAELIVAIKSGRVEQLISRKK
jgi:hypothetical protein